MSVRSKRTELLTSQMSNFMDFSTNVEDEIVRNQAVQRIIDKMMPIVAYMDNGHFVAIARCACGKESKWTADAAPRDPRVAFTKFRDRKWQASRKSLTCPACVAHKKQKPVVEFKREKPMNQIGEALKSEVAKISSDLVARTPITTTLRERPLGQDGERPPALAQFVEPTLAEVKETLVNTTTSAPTDKAKAAKRHAYSLLLDHYDELNKRYQGDWSDRRIAEMVQMSEPFVAKIREDDFGPAGPPPQFIDLKQRITQMESKLSQRETQVLQAMEMLPELQKELGLLKDQLASLVAAHGWSE